MSRSLQINTTVEYPSRYDKKNIQIAEKVLEELKAIAAGQETVSEGLKREIEKAEQILAAEREDMITWQIGILPSDIYKAATRLKISPLTTESKSVELITQPDEVLTNLVLVGLKGFKNFKHPDGTPVEFKTVKGSIQGMQVDIVDPSVLQVIQWEHQVDIGNEVRNRNSVGAANLKN